MEIKPISVIKSDVLVEPVTVQELKKQLRITHDDEDTYLSFLIVAAREALELTTQRAFAEADFTATFIESGDTYRLPNPPFVGSAKLGDDPLAAVRDSVGAFVTSEVMGNTPAPFEITYKAGSCNALGKICILMWAAHLYEANFPVDEKIEEVPLSLASFIDRLRVINCAN